MILLCSYGYVPWVYATCKGVTFEVSHQGSGLPCPEDLFKMAVGEGEGKGRESRQAAFRENELCK